MIVVDSSSLIAIAFAEPEKAAFEGIIAGHSKARLNLADCAAYALAKTMDAPLLFKGDDFAHPDVKVCAS